MASPPGSLPGHAGVVAVFQPADRRHQVQRAGNPPDTAQLSEDAVGRGRAGEGPPARLGRQQRRRISQADELDPPARVVALDPARPPDSKVAGGVVDQGQPAVAHGPKLHSRK